MTIDGSDTISGLPVVSFAPPSPGHLLSATPSTDPNIADRLNLIYEIQIASQYDFRLNAQTGLSSILQDYPNLPSPTLNWINIPNSGLLFWRIQCSDGKQSSGWSPVGNFVVNSPPNRPTNLSAWAT